MKMKDTEIKKNITYYDLEKTLKLIPKSIRGNDKWFLSGCCGEGLEASYISKKRGVKVICVDISKDQLKMVLLREKRDGVMLYPVLADAEHLPFKADTFELGVVHCGIHHLPNPHKGIEELSKVSKSGILLVEGMTT
jgi:ubiquinone/menaquinone biosynthesis C-methylase UbiE